MAKRKSQVRRNWVQTLCSPRAFISPQREMFPMAGLSGSAVNGVRTTEQKAMSDEEGLRELNPFKSPK